MNKRFGRTITAALIACLCLPEARASRGSGNIHPKEPIEFRQLVYIRSIDEKGAEFAEKLSAMFVYLHREGEITFTMNPAIAIQQNPRARYLLMKGVLTDNRMRASVQEWLKLSVSTATADFDSLGTVEAQVLSRDALTQALLSSPRFWQRLGEISAEEKFDFRPIIRREIRALQFTGNAVSWIAMGGIFGAAFRVLKLGRVAMIALAVPGVAATSVLLWDLTQNDESEALTKEALRAKTENGQADLEIDVKVLREHQRRLVILTKMRDVQAALATGPISEFKRKQPALANEVVTLKPMLENYRTKLLADQLPIKRIEDQAAIRADTARAVDFLILVATELER